MSGRERLGLSDFSPNEVVGMFMSARMRGLELTARDVARNIEAPLKDVRKMLKGKLDFDEVIKRLPDVENYLEFEPGELVRLYLRQILGN